MEWNLLYGPRSNVTIAYNSRPKLIVPTKGSKNKSNINMIPNLPPTRLVGGRILELWRISIPVCMNAIAGRGWWGFHRLGAH